MPLRIIDTFTAKSPKQSGVTLIEMIVFIVVISIALMALITSYRQATVHNADPLIRVRALESAQALLDEILSLKYDQSTPTGGVPACSSAQPGAIACTNIVDNPVNDVDDYNGYSDTPFGVSAGYQRTVTVTTSNNIKLIRVNVTTPLNETVSLAVERANF